MLSRWTSVSSRKIRKSPTTRWCSGGRHHLRYWYSPAGAAKKAAASRRVGASVRRLLEHVNPNVACESLESGTVKPCHNFLYISGAFRRLYPVGRAAGLLGWQAPQSPSAARRSKRLITSLNSLVLL